MKRIYLLALSLVLGSLLAACAGVPSSASPAAPTLEMRLQFDESIHPADSRTLFPHGDSVLELGPPHVFEVAEFNRAIGRTGFPAIAFRLVDKDAARFEEWTGSAVGRGLAILVESEVVLYCPINEPIPGQGVISGGAEGFTLAECEEMLRKLRGDPGK